ncbi:hypothetical protein SAMD00019534_027350, partial [Acytostelium subglobosum LB1]|uniref:hypothetical protein n=1 Tax=Acytostelium subglobosum LB1 TaxID=1410327 RepID=UPI00064505BC
MSNLQQLIRMHLNQKKPSLNSFIDALIRFLALTAGKDKCAKTLQYAAKFIGYYALKQQQQQQQCTTTTTTTPPLVNKWKTTESSISAARRFWRLGNILADHQKLLQMLASFTRKYKEVNYQLTLIRQVVNYMYFIMDQFTWSTSMGLTSFNTDKMSHYCNICWFTALICSITLDIRELMTVRQKEHELLQLQAADQQVSGADLPFDTELETLQQKRNDLYLNFVKNGADTMVAAFSLNFYKTSQGKIGMYGLLSALLGIYQTWPATSSSK